MFAIAVALATAGACASSAAADDGINVNTGWDTGTVSNGTPYTLTLVQAVAPGADRCGSSCWLTQPPATLKPLQNAQFIVQANSYQASDDGAGNLSYFIGYDMYFTYRADILGGPPEYLTYAIAYCYCTGSFQGQATFFQAKVFDTPAPPAAGYDPPQGGPPIQPPGPTTTSPQLVGIAGPGFTDATFQGPQGNWTVNAAKASPALADVLNAFCATATASCSFTQTGPLTAGIGTPVLSGESVNCTAKRAKHASAAKKGVGQNPPPPLDPNWFELEYEEAQSATLTVGGSVSVSVELNLFNIIASEASIKVEAEHEWEETKTLTKKSRIFIPSNNIGFIWVAPVVGKVTGTLVVSSGPSTFTIKNFTETRSGVSIGNLTPAFNVITKVRPMTKPEIRAHCSSNSTKPRTRTGSRRVSV